MYILRINLVISQRSDPSACITTTIDRQSSSLGLIAQEVLRIESVNGSFRDECLKTHWFLSLEDVRDKFEHWRQEYNNFRPNSWLGGLTPDEVEKGR
ncbi:integrase core domain-containing protein [Spirosoma aerophilum]